MSKKIFLLIVLGTFSFSLFSQNSVNDGLSPKQISEIKSYEKMKKEGVVPSDFKFSNPGSLFSANNKKPGKGTP